ncbi:MAG: hypothetical protein ACJ71B_12945 [Nitrososphaera sp.]
MVDELEEEEAMSDYMDFKLVKGIVIIEETSKIHRIFDEQKKIQVNDTRIGKYYSNC